MQTQSHHLDFKHFARKIKLCLYLKLAKLGNSFLIQKLTWISLPGDTLRPPCTMKREVIKFLYLERIGLLFRHIIYFLLNCSMGKQTDTASYACLCICAVCAKQTPKLFGDHSVRE